MIDVLDLIGIPDGRHVFSPGLVLMIISFFNLKKVKENTFSFHCLILAVVSGCPGPADTVEFLEYIPDQSDGSL